MVYHPFYHARLHDSAIARGASPRGAVRFPENTGKPAASGQLQNLINFGLGIQYTTVFRKKK
jgi:hypothetical protein